MEAPILAALPRVFVSWFVWRSRLLGTDDSYLGLRLTELAFEDGGARALSVKSEYTHSAYSIIYEEKSPDVSEDRNKNQVSLTVMGAKTARCFNVLATRPLLDFIPTITIKVGLCFRSAALHSGAYKITTVPQPTR
jgi:hypothetical protein